MLYFRMRIIVFICFSFLCSCQSKEADLYKEQDVIKIDTIDVEQIKIPTH